MFNELLRPFTPNEIDAHAANQFVLFYVMCDAPLAALFQVDAVELDGRTLH